MLVAWGMLCIPQYVHATPPPGYSQVWSDNFAGTTLNTTNWEYTSWGGGVPNAVAVNNGLTISTYTSNGQNYGGQIDTNGKYTPIYGYFEASVEFNNQTGTDGAFWLEAGGNKTGNPASAGVEYDIAEAIGVSPYFDCATHYNGYGSGEVSAGYNPAPYKAMALHSGYHTYGLLWTATSTTYYIDGEVVWTGGSSPAISNGKEYIILGILPSPGYGGNPPVGGYGSLGASTNATIKVQYVSVYRANAPTITSPSSATAAVGAAFAYQITGPYNQTTYSATGLPTGLSLNAATGSINGSPLGTGTSNVTLTATNAGGTVSAPLTITISTPSLPAPSGLTATANLQQASLSWGASSGASGYNVYRSVTSGSGYNLVASNVAATTYVDTTPTLGAVNYYVVTAFNATGQSANSNQASTTPLAAASWAVTASGTQSWPVTANWQNVSTFPDEPGVGAVINTNLTGAQTISLGQTITLASLSTGAANGGNAYTIAAGGGSLTFQNAGNGATLTQLTTSVGDTISAPIALDENLTITNNAANATLTVSGGIGDNYAGDAVTVTGPGLVQFTASNSYNGVTTVNSGMVSIFGDQSAAASGWTINSSTVNFSAGSTVATATYGSITFTNGNVDTLNVAGTVTNAGALHAYAGTSLNINSGASWTQSGSLQIQSLYNYRNPVVNVNPGGAFSYTGSSPITLAGSSAPSATTGQDGKGTLNISGGVLITGQNFNNSATADTASAANLTLSSGGTLQLSANIPNLFTNAGTVSVNVQVGTGGGIINTNGFATTITQGIANMSGQAGSLTVQGGGVLTLSGASTYTGATTINSGSLVVTGSLGATGVTVANGGTLDGTGTVGGPVTVQSGGTLTCGAGGIGTLTINNNVILGGVTQLGISQTGSTPSSDCITGMTNITFGGTLVVTNLGSGTLTPGSTFQLFNATNYSGNFSAPPTLPTLATGFTWNTSNLLTNGTIAVQDIPVAVAASAITGQNSAVTIAVLANDSDPSGSAISLQSVTQGSNGSVTISGNNVIYTSAANWSGADSFTYTIVNTWGGTATATVTVTVYPPPHFTTNPITQANATQGSAYSGSLAGTATDSYANDTFAYSILSGPAWLSATSNGALSGTPANANIGSNTWTVQVTDTFGSTATATLNIYVSGVLPSGWASADIGSVGIPGSATQSGGTYTVNGSGAGIGGTADAFQFASQPLSGDGDIRARVTSQTNTNPSAMAGVMLRETSDPGSANAMICVTPGNGFVFEYRYPAGSASVSVAGPALNTAPNNWVRLTRSGTLITAYVSADGNSWTQVGTAVISMASTINAGLAVTSDNNTTLSTANFDNVSLTPFPSPWQSVDIGSPGLQGSAEYFTSIFTVKGAGNIGGTADNFHFVYQTISGNGSITARIPNPGATGSNLRLGVMIRNDLTTGSQCGFMGIDQTGAYWWHRRSTTGGGGASLAGGASTAPNIWVRVVLSGAKLMGYESSDGTNWTLVDDYSFTLGSTVYVGLAVASGSTTTLNTTVFDNVTVTP